MRQVIPVLLVLFVPAIAASQDTTLHRMDISLNYHLGFLIAHRPLVEVLQKDHVRAVEASLSIRSDGSRQWHHTYGFPETGLSLSWWDLGNPDKAGSVIAAIPYIDFPLATSRTTDLNFKFGWGLCYVTQVFDPDENYKNVTIGSHLNSTVLAQLQVKTRISKRLHTHAGLSFLHFSNGSMVMPNLGMNLANVTLGAGYRFGPLRALPARNAPAFHTNRRMTLFAGAGVKQIYPAGGNNYFISSLFADHNWHLTPKSAFGIGADLFYNSSVKKQMEEMGQVPVSDSDLFSGGIHGGYEMIISDLSILIHMGVYLFKGMEDDENIYHRLGVRYRFSEHFFAGLHLKTHWGKADYFETGLGYFIQKQKKK